MRKVEIEDLYLFNFVAAPQWAPDGKKVAYLSYRADDLEAPEHLPNMPVELWLMNADGTGARKLVSLFGGQGTINVNSWSPDSRRFAYVRYGIRGLDGKDLEAITE